MIFDFHAHLSLKPFNSNTIYSQKAFPPDDEINRERFRPKENISPLVDALAKDINTTSQLHMESLSKSNIRKMCISLYPLERVFTQYKTGPAILGFILQNTKINDAVELAKLGPVTLRVIATLTGYEIDQLQNLKKGTFHYYNELLGAYQFLVDNQNKGDANQGILGFEIAKDYDHSVQIVQDGKIALITSIEGSNAFLEHSGGFKRLLDADKEGRTTEVLTTLTQNITDFKTKVPLFILSLAHHQYNFLCGHAESFVGAPKILLKQGGRTKVEGRNRKVHFYNLGLKENGRKVIDLLLDKTIGHGRVLIDTKHMSRQARIDFRAYIKQHNTDHPDDQIPFIQTHTAANGRSLFESSRKRTNRDELRARFKNRSEFNSASINMFDEEIIDIVETRGLMGIMLDEKRLVGKKLPKDTEELATLLPADTTVLGRDPAERERIRLENERPHARFHYNKDCLKNEMVKWIKDRKALEELKIEAEQDNVAPDPVKVSRLKDKIAKHLAEINRLKAILQDVELSILMNQFFYILKTCNDLGDNQVNGDQAWFYICIGSDYEGVINPQDIFYYAENLHDLENQLVQFWEKMRRNQNPKFDKYRAYIFNESPAFWVKRILWENSEAFLKKYFNNAYRKGTNNGGAVT
ncbi:MAG: hypothetical protein Sapg2KO_26510 [Saprospiraceae bacterium]